MRQPRREIPEVACLHVGHLRTAELVEYRHAASTVEHDCPFGLLVPVHFANAVFRESHIHAGNIGGNRKIILCKLACPTRILTSFWRVIERGPELKHSPHVRGWAAFRPL